MTSRELDVLHRFGCRTKVAIDSALASIFGGAGGAYAGSVLSEALLKHYKMSPHLERPLQAITTGAGALLGKQLGTKEQPQQMPYGSPYALDPTDQDIPAWALQGTQFLRPLVKNAFASALNVLMAENPLYPGYAGYQNGGGVGGAAKGMLGSAGGGLVGAGLGLAAGKGLAAVLGKDYNVPGINMPISHILSGLGGTVGATKALERVTG